VKVKANEKWLKKQQKNVEKKEQELRQQKQHTGANFMCTFHTCSDTLANTHKQPHTHTHTHTREV